MSFQKTLPEIVRIKRKRTEDPLQALILESNRQLKRTKSSTFIFKLAQTDAEKKNLELQSAKASVLQPNELSSNLDAKERRKTFLLQSNDLPSSNDANDKPNAGNEEENEEEDEDQVPQELADMVKEYLQLEAKQTQKDSKPVNTKGTPTEAVPSISSEEASQVVDQGADDKDYVYDVYYRDKAIYDENEKLGSNIGIIKFADEDLDLLNEEEDADSDAVPLSDDEDSNAEDFYRNDYPENEDDDKGIVIGNEEEWYSDEDDDGKARDEDDDEDDDDSDNEDYVGGGDDGVRVGKFSGYRQRGANEDGILPRRKFLREYDDETVLEKLSKENKAFNSLSMDEVDYLYHEFYEDQNKKSMIDE